MAGCAGKPEPEPRLLTRVEARCVSVADYLFECPKPVAPDPATADEAAVGRYILRLDKAIDDCQRQARTVQGELADKRCNHGEPK